MVTNSTKIFKMVYIRFLLIYGRNQHNIVKHLKLKVAQLCLTLCDPMDYTVHGILQARILEWVALPFSRDLPNPGIEPRSPTLQEDSLPAEPQGKPKNTGVGSLSFLQRIFPTQESNQGLLHCRCTLYQLSYQGSPEFEFSAKRRWSVSNPQLRLRPFDLIPVSRTGGLEKKGRLGRVKQRKEREKGKEVNKVSCSLPGRGTLASCPCQEETRDKRVPVAATGSGPSVSKLAPEYPEWSGCQSQQRRVPTKVTICCRKGDPF